MLPFGNKENTMKCISIDLETYSGINLLKSGVYRYAESPAFEILLFGYSVDGGEVKVIDLTQGEEIPPEILAALDDPAIIKSAFNASFERTCLSRFVGHRLAPEGWHCTMVWSATLGLPMSLESVGAVLGLDKQKMKEGKDLIKYFCCPCKPTKVNGGRTRNMPSDAPEKWALFKAYNKRDVETEMGIQARLSRFPVPDFIWEEYCIDQRINDRGIGIDHTLAQSAIELDEREKTRLMAELKDITKLDNPNSVVQFKGWLQEQGLKVESLDKRELKNVIKSAPPLSAKALLLRQQLAKSSVKKYTAMMNAICDDDRAHGMFMFYGAGRTGRFAGRIIQLQNLPQNHMSDLAEARELVRQGDYDTLTMLYDNIPDVLSQLVRTAFVPQDGMKFVVSDFSAIEARVLSWMAGEKWRMDVFANNGDIYCATASRMFHCNVVKHGENGELRQKGKQAELACGYGGSVGALKAMGALDAGMKENELKPLVDSWREANPHIVRLWWDVDEAVKTCVRERTHTETHGLKFTYQSGFLFITLPSGRRLAYVRPRMGENRFGGEAVTYEGSLDRAHWGRMESYGPKFVENITQAISRDILVYAMRNLAGYRICAHVHDEVIIEVPRSVPADEVCKIMGRTPPWAKGLVLRADGYECDFYMKD